MLKIKKNIEVLLLLAIPLLAFPPIFLFGSWEYRLATLFFMLSVITTLLLQLISIKFFHNIIPAIAGSAVVKIGLLSVIVFSLLTPGSYSPLKLIIAFLTAFLASKLYEIKTLKYLTAQNSAKQEIKGC